MSQSRAFDAESSDLQTGDALHRLREALATSRARAGLVRRGGTVVHASSTEYRIAGLSQAAQIGDLIEFETDGRSVSGEVVSIDAQHTTVEPYEVGASVGLSHPVWLRGPLLISPSPDWKGRVINALARPLDDGGPLPEGTTARRTETTPPDALRRRRIETPVATGVKVIDIFTPLCAGQRLGVFAGSGVGKSTLLGMLARAQGFDTIVVALVGERGREVREFVEDILGATLANAVVVVATGDESPMMRRQAPRTAMTIAEFFRERGDNVLMIVDSITRYAHALREVALAAGEPPVARGYAPSIFAELPLLLERAGPGLEGEGTTTGLFSVLVDGDDHNEPVADTVRGILDGHIVLDRDVAARGQYPAVNLLSSISRLANKAWTPEQEKLVKQLKKMIAEFEDTRELRLLGAYKPGANRELDFAVEAVPRLYQYLTQAPDDAVATDPFREMAALLASKPGAKS